ncbi:MAG: tRNA pseudouridine(55) synthase TruB [Polyangiales bacterium]
MSEPVSAGSGASHGVHGVHAVHGVLVVDKPIGPTSHDVVRQVRRALRTRAVGHAGTLDPMASGVLVLGIGEGTKLLQHLTGADKSYVTTIRLGSETDSLDAQGSVTATAPVPTPLTLADVAQVAAGFRGELLQRAPEISAIKVDGERLYARARRGEQVVAPERRVVVHELEVLTVDGPDIRLRVRCSKGFYVRALARDLAAALGTLGHLTQLRRTHSGAFGLEEALDGALLKEQPIEAAARARVGLLPLSAALRDCPRCVLTAAGVEEVRHGRPVRPEHVDDPASALALAPGQQPIALVDASGALRALGRAEADRVVVIRGMAQA